MSVMRIYKAMDIFAHKCFREYCAKLSSKEQFEFFKMHNIEHKRLTSTQKKEVKKIWGPEADYDTHEIILSVNGRFDPLICPENILRKYIDIMLNNRHNTHSWDDKNYFDRFVPNGVFPYAILRNISGTFYDHDYNVLTENEAFQLLSQENRCIIKPSLASGVGRGVKLLTASDINNKIFDEYKKDFIVQKVLVQHDVLKKFSPQSVNIIRILTLRINNKIEFLSAMLRAGADGGITDNHITEDGRGMLSIGIDSNGVVQKYGFYCSGERVSELPNGFCFEGLKIPNFKGAVDLACEAHKQLELFDFIGWDIVIQEDETPIIMEYNLRGPGILAQQMLHGPLFGKFTNAISNQYLKKFYDHDIWN